MKIISEYITNSAETNPTARKHRMAVTLLRHIKSSRLKPEKANTPPHMPKITKFKVQIKHVRRIRKVCAVCLQICLSLNLETSKTRRVSTDRRECTMKYTTKAARNATPYCEVYELSI